uniref:Uncharacterized protein n=1 Tax=Romanomermis culicivorax TaxID=13658 RepID=A0A915JDA8_ROMCU
MNIVVSLSPFIEGQLPLRARSGSLTGVPAFLSPEISIEVTIRLSTFFTWSSLTTGQEIFFWSLESEDEF